MNSTPSIILKTLNDYKAPDGSKQLLFASTQQEFGGYLPDGLAPEFLTVLSPFALEVPQKYYREEALKEVWTLMNASYAKNPTHTIDFIRRFDDLFHYGFDHLIFLCELLNQVNIESMSRRAKFDFCLLPWYAKTIEGIYSKVIRPVLAAVLFLEENELDLDKIGKLKVRQCYDKLNKHNKYELIFGCNFCVRNAIAHQKFLFEDRMFEPEKLRFEDLHTTEVLYDQEVIDLFEDLLDTCSGIIIGTLLFCFNHLGEIQGNSTATTFVLTTYLRQQLVRDAVTNDLIEVRELNDDIVNDIPTITIEVVFEALTTEEELIEALRILHVCHIYYPEHGYNIKINNPKTKEKLHWLMVNNAPVKRFFAGDSTDAELLKAISERSMLPPIKTFFGRKRGAFRRAWLHLKSKTKPKPAKSKACKILSINDSSTGITRRYRAIIAIPTGLTKNEIRPMVKAATEEVKKQRVYGNEMMKKNWQNQPPEVIWLGVFTKEKRARDMAFLDEFDHYICNTEWVSEDSDKGIISSFDETWEDIKISWNKRLYPLGNTVPEQSVTPIGEGLIIESDDVPEVILWDKPGGLGGDRSKVSELRGGARVIILNSQTIDGHTWLLVRAKKQHAGEEGWLFESLVE